MRINYVFHYTASENEFIASLLWNGPRQIRIHNWQCNVQDNLQYNYKVIFVTTRQYLYKVIYNITNYIFLVQI